MFQQVNQSVQVGKDFPASELIGKIGLLYSCSWIVDEDIVILTGAWNVTEVMGAGKPRASGVTALGVGLNSSCAATVAIRVALGMTLARLRPWPK